MDRIECSIWNNGATGWGFNILGGSKVRDSHFNRKQSPVYIDLDGSFYAFNVDKDSFWKNTPQRCIHLININVKKWSDLHGLNTGDRVWLEILERYRRFRAVPMEAASKKIA